MWRVQLQARSAFPDNWLMPAGSDLHGAVDTAFDQMVDTRRLLHRTPELAFDEHATTAVIRERLAGLGLAGRPCPTPTGAVAVLDGGRPGLTVLLRADIDGLPVVEEAASEFRSERDGVMHACGHDAHTATLLGVAEILSARASEIPGRYVFVFQPAEEQLAGAKAMLDAGLLEGLDVSAAVGWHVISQMPAGVVYCRPGVMLSDGQGLRITFAGAGGHGAMGGPNVVLAAAELARSMADAVTGLEYEGAPCICSPGIIQAGTAMNVLPSRAVVEGTLRTYTPAQKDEALDRLRSLISVAAEKAGVDAELTLTVHAPPVDNDVSVTDLVLQSARATLGARHVVIGPPMPPSDDVSEFLRVVPGCYFFVGGGRADGSSGMHHSPHFSIDEQAMRVAAIVMTAAALSLADHRD
jgi:amidohydrolase